MHIANYSTKDCFADLVCQGNYTVEFLMKEYKMRADQIILIGDSFGGAVAEYVFMHFYNRKTILGGRIISNSFCDFSKPSMTIFVKILLVFAPIQLSTACLNRLP